MANKETISLDELYSSIEKFNLSDSLHLIGSINATMKYGIEQGCTENIHTDVLNWLDRFKNDRITLLDIFLVSTRLARFLLLSQANDFRNNFLEIGSIQFSDVLNQTENLFDQDVEKNLPSPFSISRILGRLSHWQFPLQDDRRVQIGRAYLLFIILPSKIQSSYNYEEKMRAYFGIGVYEFLATGIVLWMKTNGTQNNDITIEIDGLKKHVNARTINTFVELSSGTQEDYKKLIRGENWQHVNKLYDIYGLEPLLRMPFIKIHRSVKLIEETHIVPQPKYLLDRTCTGIFYLLSDIEQRQGETAGNKGQNAFRVDFGLIYREYVSLQLRQTKSKTIFIDLDSDVNLHGQIKRPDFALVLNDVCILFEVKTTVLKIESRTIFDEEKIKCEIKTGSFQKAIKDQLHSFRQKILNGDINDKRFEKVKRVINILVTYEDIFVLNHSILSIIKETYGEAGNDLQLASISDIDSIGNALIQNVNIGDFLKGKIDNQEKEYWSIAAFLEPSVGKGNKILLGFFSQFMKTMEG